MPLSTSTAKREIYDGSARTQRGFNEFKYKCRVITLRGRDIVIEITLTLHG
jgi:hypothetical protein